MASDRAQRLGPSERLFTAFRRFAPTNLVRVIAIEGQLTPERIGAALPALRARHPLLNVRVRDGWRPAFVAANGAALSLRVVRRRHPEQWRGVLEQLLNTPLSRHPGPLLQLHYVYAPEQPRGELLVVCDHVICDGVSVNALCAELLSLCAGEPPGPALRVLPVLAGLLPTYGVARRALEYGRGLATFARAAARRVAHEQRVAGRTTRFLTRALTREQTQTLVARCRAEHTTLTGALMAAALRALRGARVTAPRLLLALPVNLRPHLPQHALTAQDLGNYTSVVHLDAERGRQEFWSDARALKRQLSRLARPCRLLSALGLTYRTGRLFVRASRPPFAHALISNSGIVPLRRDYGTFRAAEFFSANSASMLSADVALFCNTFEQRLRINLVFLEEVVEPCIASQVLDALAAWLTQPSWAAREPVALPAAGAA